MKIANIFCFQKWPLKSFLTVSVMVQLSLIVLIALDRYVVDISNIRQIIAFLYITFIPGFLILRCIRLDSIDSTQSILLSVSLSLGYCIICGYLLNVISPLLGIFNPMSALNVLALLVIPSMIMSVYCYIDGRREINSPIYIDLDEEATKKALLISLLPFLTIIGTSLMNRYNNNLLLVFVLILIALIPLIISLNKLPRKLFGYSIFISSICILFHTSLISDLLWGWDIQYEYFVSNSVLANQWWNAADAYGLNSLLLLTIIAPVYSMLMELDLVWVFKIIFPFLYSLVPLALYQLYQGIFKDNYLSALSPFCLIFYYGFFKTMPDKQELSELFLVLILSIILLNKIKTINWKSVLLVLSFSLIVSHYGMSFLFLFVLIVTLCLTYLYQRYANDSISKLQNTQFFMNFGVFCVLFGVLVITWYYLTSSGSNFDVVVNIGAKTSENFLRLVEDPSTRTGVSYATTQMPTLIWQIFKIPFYVLIGLISIGIIATTFNQIVLKKAQFSVVYIFIALIYYSFMIISIFLTLGLGMDRAIQIALITLSPFVIIGLETIIKRISNSQQSSIAMNSENSFKVSRLSSVTVAIFLLIFLLFNSGVFFELVKDPNPPLFAINKSTDFPVFTITEHAGVTWLITNKNLKPVVADARDKLLLSEYIWKDEIGEIYPETKSVGDYGYIYLGKYAAEEKVLLGDVIVGFNREHIPISNTILFGNVLRHKNNIYNNGKSEILT